MKYKIVLVPFPFDDLSGKKVRPAICLTPTIGTYKHVIIAFITSQVHLASEPSDLVIQTTDKNFSLTGLKVDSAVRLHRLVTIPKRIILRQLGELPINFQTLVEAKLKTLFSI